MRLSHPSLTGRGPGQFLVTVVIYNAFVPNANSGLTLQYNSGAVEGTVNKIKARKLQLFGRAKHDLLRKLILMS